MPKKETAPTADERLFALYCAALASNADDAERALTMARRALEVWERR